MWKRRARALRKTEAVKKKKIKLKECFPPADLIKNLRTLQVHPFKLWFRSRQLAGCHEPGFRFSNYRELPRTAQSGLSGGGSSVLALTVSKGGTPLLSGSAPPISVLTYVYHSSSLGHICFSAKPCLPFLNNSPSPCKLPWAVHLAQLVWRVRTSTVRRPCSSGRTRTLILLTLLWTICTTLSYLEMTVVVSCTFKPPSGHSNTLSL